MISLRLCWNLTALLNEVFILVGYLSIIPGGICLLFGVKPCQLWENKMKNIVRFLKDKAGATAIEYGLIAALIAVAVISGVTALGTNANNTFTNVSSEIAKGA
jgi:pilus assembly protein Flp/PilA